MVLAVIRASDGASFHLYKHDLHNITTLDELRYNVLSTLLDIPPDYLICMNEEGAQLRDESVQHLALLAGSPLSSTTLPTSPNNRVRGSSPSKEALKGKGVETGERERRIYVFDRDHLDADAELVAQALNITDEQVLIEPPLEHQDPLQSHIGLSLHHLDTVHSLISSISLQHASLHLALANLHRVNTGTNASLQVFVESTSPNLQTWSSLLEGWEGSMNAIQKVVVVPGLLGNRSHARAEGMGSATNSSGAAKERYLGDYVSREKMGAVRDGCQKVLDDLKTRTYQLKTTIDTVLAETAAMQSEFDATSRDMDDLDACSHDTEMCHQRIEELVRASEEMRDPELLSQCFDELSHADAEHRDRIRFLVQHKNAMTRYLVITMQRISGLQSDIATMPSLLGELDHDARTKTDNFKHLARLEGLIPAYVATIIEVVRRREYSALLGSHTKALGTTLEHLSDTEKEKRTRYRSRFSGKLPWEVKGLVVATDEGVPFVDFGVQTGVDELLPNLDRATVQDLRKGFVDLEQSMGQTGAKNPIADARVLLDDLVKDLDELKNEFEKVALDPQQVVAATSTAQLARAQEVDDLQSKVKALEEVKEALERELQTVRTSHEEEVAQLDLQIGQASAAKKAEETRLAEIRSELEQERTLRSRERSEWEKEKREAKRAREEVDRRAVEDARAFKAREAELELLLGAAKKVEDEIKTHMANLDRRHATLSSDHDEIKGELSRAHSTTEELENQLKTVETSSRELTVVLAEKERMLREQRAEAELDRAVLEKEVQNLRSAIEGKEAELTQKSARESTLEEIASGLREQISHWQKAASGHEVELHRVKEEMDSTQQDKNRSLSETNRELQKTANSARAAMKLAGQLRDEYDQITRLLTSTASAKDDSSSENVSAPRLDEKGSSTDSAPPRDYEAGKLEDLLAELISFEPATLTDAVRTKIDALSAATKKWVKEAKAYRERAHRAQAAANEKIAFRNFAKGDLALFLPTRNSVTPVWAAFNVSFPHHFLLATGVIQEQIKTREWIVARITSLTEKLADAKDKDSNPYQLAAGTKYFHLEVEPWSAKDHSGSKRRHSTSTREKRLATASSNKPRMSDPAPSSNSAVDITGAGQSPGASKRPAPSRRSVSEGGAPSLPSNATALARSEFTIIEEHDDVVDPSSPPSPGPARFHSPLPESPLAPSGLSVAFARSRPSSPTQIRRNDSFSTNPFAMASSSPPINDSFGDGSIAIISPPATDYEPTATSAGAVPAFLPRKTPSASASSSRNGSQKDGSNNTTSNAAVLSKLSPRYIRSSSQTGSSTASKPTPIVGASQRSPSSATSPSGAGHFPRSASSGSSILSASMYRRRPSAVSGTSPFEKALPTTEVMDGSARWTSITDSLPNSRSSPTSSSNGVNPVLGRQQREGSREVQKSTSTIARARRISTTASMLEALTGKTPPTNTGSAVEGEVRRLLSPK